MTEDTKTLRDEWEAVSISDHLAAYGITHEAGPQGGHHYLRWRGQSIGTAHAGEACALLNMLAAIRKAEGLQSPEGGDRG